LCEAPDGRFRILVSHPFSAGVMRWWNYHEE
jgi:hypothetical protein